jgi:hypothetical protein
MKKELNVENVQVAGYMHFYIKNGQTKTKIIPVELKNAFIERFGNDLLNADEDEVVEFIKNGQKNVGI